MAKIETWIDDNLHLLYSNKFPNEKVMVYRKMQKYKVELLKHCLENLLKKKSKIKKKRIDWTKENDKHADNLKMYFVDAAIS